MKRSKALVFAGMGFELFAIAVVAAPIGNLLNEKFGWGKAGTVGVFLICFLGWLVHFIILIQKFMKETNDHGTE